LNEKYHSIQLLKFYTLMVPSPAVFYELFQLEEGKKEWKQKKIPLDDFEKVTRGLYASASFVKGEEMERS
jgi:hypothetical protein